MGKRTGKRWSFVCLSLLLAAVAFMPAIAGTTSIAYAEGKGSTLVGAIRWDAWVGDLNTDGVGAPYVGHQVEATLGPNKYHFRLPFFAVETGTDSVQARELTQSVMDQQIAYAKNAGIDYWAFVYYPDNSGMDTARNLYFSSTHKNDINYNFILGAGVLPTSNFDWLVTKFQESNYQKVLSGRPLLYIFGGTGGYTSSDITTLRNKTTTAGLPNPYIVVMGSASDANSIGADALSAYNTWMGGGGPYSGLMAADQNGWNSAKNTGKKVIPWVTTGLDARPRYDNPVTWMTVGPNDWVQTATPSEIATNLQNALNWIDANSSTAEANTVLIYAWNEFDEGGWICPTLYNGTDRLDAIRNVLFPPSGGTNLALGHTYSSSSNWDVSQTADKAFDGNSSTNWQAASGSSYNGQWAEVDFGTNTTFNRVVLSEYGSRTGGFRIEYWNGLSWQTAYTGWSIGSHSSPSTHTFAAVTGSKARIYYTSGTYTPILYEFGIYNDVTNLALGHSYSSSSNWDASQTADKAFDNSLGTNWQAASGSTFHGQWAQVDFGTNTTFSKVVLSEYGSRTSGFRIEYWNGASWQTAYTGTSIGNPSSPSSHTFTAVTGSKARIYYTSGTYTPVLYEFGIYTN